MSASSKEIIVLRSLTESDLGIFAAHRSSATSKQRAINVNVSVAKRLLSDSLFAKGVSKLKCLYVFRGTINQEIRRFGKTHKNWRLGGKKLEGPLFSALDAKDFVLIRSREANDGSHPVTVTFISRHTNHILHAGFVAIFGNRLIDSMIVISEDEKEFDYISEYCIAHLWAE